MHVEAPLSLLKLQLQMGGAIREKVAFGSGKFVFASDHYSEELCKLIFPRGIQSSRQRMAIYNEQYWFRLFTLLQEEFPLTATTMGMWKFNQCACDYLTAYPSHSFSLDFLAENFCPFLQMSEKYSTPLLNEIVEIEWKITASLYAKKLDQHEVEKFLNSAASSALDENSILQFHPGFGLFKEHWNIMEVRKQLSLLTHKNGALATFVPPQSLEPGQENTWVLFRNEGKVFWRQISGLQFQLLADLKAGMPLGEACEKLSEGLSETKMSQLGEGLPTWFATWTALGWFYQ